MEPYEDQSSESIDITKLRYALYVRKSTDDKERQQRSVDDQIAECEELAAKLGITLVKPYYRDDGSAKIPDNPKRDQFYKLLNDIRSFINFSTIFDPKRLTVSWHGTLIASLATCKTVA